MNWRSSHSWLDIVWWFSLFWEDKRILFRSAHILNIHPIDNPGVLMKQTRIYTKTVERCQIPEVPNGVKMRQMKMDGEKKFQKIESFRTKIINCIKQNNNNIVQHCYEVPCLEQYTIICAVCCVLPTITTIYMQQKTLILFIHNHFEKKRNDRKKWNANEIG